MVNPDWLESLEEDWPSAPPSEAPSLALPPLKSSQSALSPRSPGSKIPVPRRGLCSSVSLPHDSSFNILSERSANEINIRAPQRTPSKLTHEVRLADQEALRKVRTTSHSTNSSNGSVIHNTVHIRSPASSPLRIDTPEWRKELLQNGEQKDLFSSGAVGLQKMFVPPPRAEEAELEDDDDDEAAGKDVTFPSSPPPWKRLVTPAAREELEDAFEDGSQDEQSPSPSPRRPRQLRYRMNESGTIHESRQDDESSAEQLDFWRPGSTKNDDDGTKPSSLEVPPPPPEVRKTSGHSVIQNEDFSEISLEKQVGNDGRVDFTPAVKADQLRDRLERLKLYKMAFSARMPTMSDLGRPQDEKSVNSTDAYVRNGGFINLKRGGAAEGSWMGKGFGSTLATDTSEMLPDDSLQASTPKQFPSLRREDLPSFKDIQFSPIIPPAPAPSPEKMKVVIGGGGGSSPLKLFANQNTYTRGLLMRRLSQFEEPEPDEDKSELDHSQSPQSRSNEYRSEFDETPAPRMPTYHTPYPARSRSVSHFGEGDLEGYEFEAEVDEDDEDDEDGEDGEDGEDCGDGGDAENKDEEQGSDELEGKSEHDGDKENIAPSPSGRTANPKFRFDVFEGSPLSNRNLPLPKIQRSLAAFSFKSPYASLKNVDAQLEEARRSTLVATPKRGELSSDMKRPRASPMKDPTPKRRRTLHRSDIAWGREDILDSTHSSHLHMQALMGNSTVQESEMAIGMVAREGTNMGSPTPGARGSRPTSQDSQARLMVDEYLRSPRRTKSRDGGDGAESAASLDYRSTMKTQDWLKEAGKVMAMIRNQVQLNGLGSVDESELNSFLSPGREGSFEESTIEPLSRPPSREGAAPVSRIPRQQEDPELITRLKQYQEFSDYGDIITSSLRSMALAQDVVIAAQEIEKRIHAHNQSRLADGKTLPDDELYDDLANIPLTSPIASQDEGADDKVDYPSSLSGHSTTRTIHTGSSRGYDAKKTIAPQSVSHLIPDQVGSMCLDRERNVWMKKKARGPSLRRSRNVMSSEDSEDDPFASIPDLSVDMTTEMRNLKRISPLRPEMSTPGRNGTTTPSPSPSARRLSPRAYVTLSPDAALTQAMPSQARDELNRLESITSGRTSTDGGEDDEAEEEGGVGEEVSSLDRGNRSRPGRRNLTISFSSPIASVIHDVMVAEDLDDLEDDPETSLDNDSFNMSRDVRYQSLSKSLRTQVLPRPRAVFRAPSRQFSVGGQSFTPRPVSRISEHDDEDVTGSRASEASDKPRDIPKGSSLVLLDRHRPSTDLAVADSADQSPLRTPGQRTKAAVHPDNSTILNNNVGNLSLSPLSEFTIHQHEPSFGFEVSYVLGDRYMVTGDATKRVMSAALCDLVDRLAEAEPYEPHWEDVGEMDLHGKRLGSLHGLWEFCPRLVTLDVSQNALTHLDGLPKTVRELKVSGNLLSELTSWTHLMNLQYLDISNNDIKSLSGLRGLVHLRSLKADNNKLTSLDGLSFHDGLLSVRARDNHVTELDFEVIRLNRLEELDVAGNKIEMVRGLEQLPALKFLKLQRNRLESLEPAIADGHASLRHLDLTDNRLRALDISKFSGLHLLHADRNCLTRVSGFSKTRHLDSLSLREQRGEQPLDMSFLAGASEIRKLYLSGNNMGVLEPKVDFLNLQLLEIANCGLQALPAKLGQLMPNLRTLNVNFNAISDLSPIRFIARLKKLLAAGNRLSDSGKVTAQLTEFPHLTQLDLRDNPVTQGFYAPLQVFVASGTAAPAEPFSLPDADTQRDAQFASWLDTATSMRMRLYRVVFVGSCRRLRMLDGLALDRTSTLAKDEGFMALVREGLLPDFDAPPTPKAVEGPKTTNEDAKGPGGADAAEGEEP